MLFKLYKLKYTIMRNLAKLRNVVAIVAAVSLMSVGSVYAQDSKPKKMPIKNTPVVPPSNKMPGIPDSGAFSKKDKKGLPKKMVDKPTGEKHNGFDVFIDAQNKKFYLDEKGEKKFLAEKEK